VCACCSVDILCHVCHVICKSLVLFCSQSLLIEFDIVEVVGLNLEAGIDNPLLSQLSGTHDGAEIISDCCQRSFELVHGDFIADSVRCCSFVRFAAPIGLPSGLTVREENSVCHRIHVWAQEVEGNERLIGILGIDRIDANVSLEWRLAIVIDEYHRKLCLVGAYSLWSLYE